MNVNFVIGNNTVGETTMTNNIKGPNFDDATNQGEVTMKNKFNWGDFNDAADHKTDFKYDLASLKDKLISQLPSVLTHLFPAGKFQDKQFLVGSLKGEKGKSLVVEFSGIPSYYTKKPI